MANLASSSGATEWTYGYDPFGNDSNTKNDPNAPTNVMRFDGQVLDPAAGLYYLRARVYDQSTGRFLQLDPLPVPADTPYVTAYAYVANRPTAFDDPAGLCVIGLFGHRCDNPVYRFVQKARPVVTGVYNFARGCWRGLPYGAAAGTAFFPEAVPISTGAGAATTCIVGGLIYVFRPPGAPEIPQFPEVAEDVFPFSLASWRHCV